MMNDRIWTLLGRQLTGEATSVELEELEQLISASPAAEKGTSDVTYWWGQQSPADTDFLEATYLAHLERMKHNGIDMNDDELPSEIATGCPAAAEQETVFKSNFNTRRLLIAAVLILGIALSWLFLDATGDDEPHKAMAKAEVATRNGSRSKILLPDGTNVWLNSGSKLTYSRDMDQGAIREVTLTGEAFFDVVKNEQRPFVIHTSRIDVKVLGTRFNVKAYEEDQTTETSLLNGSVEISLKAAPGKKYVLKPNEKLVLSNNLPSKAAKTEAKVALPSYAAAQVAIKPLTYLQGAETDVESSWTKNVLSFEDEAFIDVARKMERWYDVTFEFKDKRWQQQFLNGSFKNENLQQAMTALKYSTGFNYTLEGRKVVIF